MTARSCPACNAPVERGASCREHDPDLRTPPASDWLVIIALWIVTLVGLAAANTWMGNWS